MTPKIDASALRGDAPTQPRASRSADAPVGDPSPGAGTARATGKVILIGEHSVVYGHPAIALPITSISARAEVTMTTAPSRIDSELFHGSLAAAPDRLLPTVTAVRAAIAAVSPDAQVHVRILSDIPSERGVGSSAAVAGAVVSAVSQALGRVLTPDERFDLIQDAERAAHGSPSGLDARAVCAPGPIWFQQGAIEHITVGAALHLVVADSGVRGRTREAVAAVREVRRSAPSVFDAAVSSLSALTTLARTHISAGDLAGLGAALNAAHRHLGTLGVGDPALDHLAAAARAGGSPGAKLTGGGRGGCVLALADDPEHAAELVARLRAAGAPAAWTTHMEIA
ncbi:mevalonate kinase [Microbacterium xanthum]|uniref:mevalonate kinase n=1 Tax=Microbacterium xanthum TaxID=3079794 RepID=UPI002AD219A0|nr:MULTISPECIES: mevalonate kinase [unclassified Microbacterium]MDZ8172735.1 mevalonate kinase [Microbacterium sp. KSW-48]MDZ8202427.1 mevalonate kinase [Microbacterium sp. SSW1-59]